MTKSKGGSSQTADYSPTTVGGYIRRAFPTGTRPSDDDAQDLCMPAWPPDVFAATASLLEMSGAYHHFAPNKLNLHENDSARDPFGILGQNYVDLRINGVAWAYTTPFVVQNTGLSEEKREELIGQAVRRVRDRYPKLSYHFDEIGPDALFQAIISVSSSDLQGDWNTLVGDTSPIFVDFGDDGGFPSLSPEDVPLWWGQAMRLLIMADEASIGLGFSLGSSRPSDTWWQRYYHKRILVELEAAGVNVTGSDERLLAKGIQSLTIEFDQNLGRVLPKTRTPSVGCTLRSLSHNLSLLPAQGKVETRWSISRRPHREQAPLNILLIPFPYQISSECFVPSGKQNGDGQPANAFRVGQCWLPHESSGFSHAQVTQMANKFANFVYDLVVASEAEIHAVVLPECALDMTFFAAVKTLLQTDSEIEVLIAGLSENEMRRRGNYVAMYSRIQDDAVKKAGRDAGCEWEVEAIRPKHHRWKLDRSQLQRYALSHRLDPAHSWWEDLEIPRRIIDICEFRHGSTLTTLICEDLARIEPCQSVIRAVGPNLVIVLLMDGPQLNHRWPNQYAGVLADDPGCSVLTLTSMGLIERAALCSSSSSRAMALWKEPGGHAQSLELPQDYHALILTLNGSILDETTLDGRNDGAGAFGWTLGGVIPVKAPSKTEPWILNGRPEIRSSK